MRKWEVKNMDTIMSTKVMQYTKSGWLEIDMSKYW